MIAINKHSVKPKIRCFKMPNAPYLKRCVPLDKKENENFEKKYINYHNNCVTCIL